LTAFLVEKILPSSEINEDFKIWRRFSTDISFGNRRIPSVMSASSSSLDKQGALRADADM
jgi:hypothetical protein